MALKKALVRSESKTKGHYAEAYFRVMSVNTRDDGSSEVKVVAFADSDARKLALQAGSEGPAPMPHMMGQSQAGIMEKTINAVLPAAPAGEYSSLQEQAKAAAYVHLKTLPEFLTAVDC